MRISASRCIGVVAALVGAGWLWTCLVVPVYRGIAESHWGVFTSIMFPVLSIPGWFAVVFGVKVIREPNTANIARSVGSLFCFLVIAGSREISDRFDPISGDHKAYSMTLPILILALMPVYVRVAKAVMRREGIVPDGLHDFFGKPFMALFALLVFGALRNLFELFVAEDYMDYPNDPVTFAVNIAPVVIAWFAYKFFKKKVGIDSNLPQYPGPTHA